MPPSDRTVLQEPGAILGDDVLAHAVTFPVVLANAARSRHAAQDIAKELAKRVDEICGQRSK